MNKPSLIKVPQPLEIKLYDHQYIPALVETYPLPTSPWVSHTSLLSVLFGSHMRVMLHGKICNDDF